MPRENKPIEVVLEYHLVPDAEQRLEAAFDMIFRKMPKGRPVEGGIDAEHKD